MIGNLLAQFKNKLSSSPVSGDVESLYKNGIRMLKIGNYEAALEEFKLATAANPKQAFTFFYLGTVYFNLNSFSEAKKSYEKFLELYSASSMEEVLEFDPNLDCDRIHSDVYNNLGNIYTVEENLIKAMGCYQRAIRAKRDRTEPINNLGTTYFKMGLYQDAIKAFERALNVAPDDETAQYGLGLVYVDLKNKSEVTKKIQILEGINPGMADDLSKKIFLGQRAGQSRI